LILIDVHINTEITKKISWVKRVHVFGSFYRGVDECIIIKIMLSFYHNIKIS